MEYTLDEFDALADRVRAAGGVLLDELCETREHHFPDAEVAAVPQAVGWLGVRRPFVYTAYGCKNHTVFEIPYVVQRPSIRDKSPLIMGKIKLCAVCDSVGAMPRFKEPD